MASGECSKYDQPVRRLKPIPLQGDVSDGFIENFALFSIDVKQPNLDSRHHHVKINKKSNRCPERISPSEFVTLQRLRSSALACRTSTTIKTSRNNDTLFDDLINNDTVVKNKVSHRSFLSLTIRCVNCHQERRVPSYPIHFIHNATPLIRFVLYC